MRGMLRRSATVHPGRMRPRKGRNRTAAHVRYVGEKKGAKKARLDVNEAFVLKQTSLLL